MITKKRKVYFDIPYQHNEHFDVVPKKDRECTIRLEGRIIEETDIQYKVKTFGFFGYYGHQLITQPKVSYGYFKPEINGYYWINKSDAIFTK